MSGFKILLLLIVIVTFSYILYKLANKRYMIKSEMEGFTIQNSVLNPFRTEKQKMENELDSVKKASPGKIDHYTPLNDVPSLPLREFCILSSYNTAVTGTFVNIDMIKHVLERGYRFIDFEIFAKADIPYIGSGTANELKLVDILNGITDSAFSQPCPNYKDPLFIHLRVKDAPGTRGNDVLYKNISTLLNNGNVKQYLYDKKVTSDTLLSALRGKIVVIMNSDDKTCEKSGTTCNNIIQMTGITSDRNSKAKNVIRSTDYYRLLDQKPQRPTINKKNMTTNQTADQLQLVVPDDNVNPAFKPVVSDYCIQIVSNQLFLADKNMDTCEKVFNANKSAFVPFAIMIPYLDSPAYKDLIE
jgi:hypothetical protein